MATANFDVGAHDGWVKITDITSVSFIRVHGAPRSQSYFITSSATTPASTVRGFKVDCEDFMCDVETTDDYYVRVPDPRDSTKIDVFYIGT